MTWVAVGVGGATLAGSLIGSNQAAGASRDASGVLQSNIERGLDEQEIAQQQALQALLGGTGQNLDFLNQARGQFGTAAGLTDPAIQNLQGTSTAAGRSSSLQDILNDPNQAALFDQVARQTGNDLSSLGIRRSGAGVGLSQANKLNFANQLLDRQDASQQGLANIGLGANSALANLLAQSGSVAGTGGANQANLIQQGSANRLNLLGQLGQAQAAGITGPANIQNQNLNSLIGLSGQLGGAFIGNQ